MKGNISFFIAIKVDGKEPAIESDKLGIQKKESKLKRMYYLFKN